MNDNVSLFAPAKIIVFGEHSVLYGAPAIAIPLNGIGTEAVWEPSESSSVSLVFENKNINMDPIQKAVKTLKQLINFKGFKLYINSYLPIGAGLGSSAALSYLLVRSALLSLNKEVSKKQLNKYVFELEKIFHGNPSGIDNTVVTYNKPCVYKTPQIDIDIPWIGYSPSESFYICSAPKPEFTIGYSGSTSLTSKMVNYVKLQLEDENKKNEFIRVMTEIFLRGTEKWSEKDYEGMGSYMVLAHHQYRSLGISTPNLDMMVRLAINAGAYGAKLTGAGGGGCIIALVNENTKYSVQDSWEEAGFSVII